MKKIAIILISLFLFAGVSFASDPADFIVVLDQSGSIYHNLPVVKEYVKKSIVKTVAKEKDNIYIFSFDGLFHFHKTLKGKAADSEIDEVLNSINAVGMYTDLTNAVEKMREYIQNSTDPDRRKVVFFLTDGVNDPPYFSPYKEGLNHRFFQDSKKTVMEGGWRVFVTGIGNKTDGAAVASFVGAEYIELSPKPELSEFDAKLTERLREARKGYGFWPYIGGVFFLLIAGGGAYFYIARR